MAFTKVQIISQISVALGNGIVADILSDDPFVVQAVSIYDLFIESILSNQNWRFATKVQQLNLTPFEPLLKEWRFILELPADYLAMQRVQPQVPYEIFENKHLYANDDKLVAVYRFVPDVTRFPTYFVKHIVFVIAEFLAIPVAQREDFAKFYDAKAQSSLASALFTDSQSHPNQAIISRPFINVRLGFGSRVPDVSN